MYTILTIILTLAVIFIFYWILNESKKKAIKQKWYVWALVAAWIAVLVMAVSFVVLNLDGGHYKATSTGIFVFFIPLIIGAILILRIAGLFNIKKGKGASVGSTESGGEV